jgi:multiple sugar transport system substrate-binding protein
VDAACQVAVVDPDRARQLDLDPPATWESVLETARRIPGSVGIPLYPSDAVLSLLSLTRNLRAHGEAEDGFWSQEAVRILVELAASVDPRCFDLNPPRMLDLMSSDAGNDAPAYVPLLFGYTNYQRPHGALGRPLCFLDTPSVGDTPAGAILGGAGLAVSAHTPNPHEAAAFATWFAGTATQRDVVLPHGGQPGSRAVWDDPNADALVGGFFSGTRRTIDTSHVRPRAAWWPAYQDAAGVLLAKMLRQRESATVIHSELTGLLTRARPQEPMP